METESSLREVRDVQRRHWTSVADAWGKWFDWTEENFTPLTAWLRDQTGWRPGANVLDIGCGSGYPALAAAAAARPSGTVTAIDISPRMRVLKPHDRRPKDDVRVPVGRRVPADRVRSRRLDTTSAGSVAGRSVSSQEISGGRRATVLRRWTPASGGSGTLRSRPEVAASPELAYPPTPCRSRTYSLVNAAGAGWPLTDAPRIRPGSPFHSPCTAGRDAGKLLAHRQPMHTRVYLRWFLRRVTPTPSTDGCR